MQHATIVKKENIPYLVGLRGLAILLAASFHCIQYFTEGIYDDRLTWMPYLAMALFFCLSGFVLTLNYGTLFSAPKPATGIYNFYVARIARLCPVYAIFLPFAASFMPADIFSHFSQNWPRVLSYLTMTQSWANNQSISSVGTISWSISNEIFSYMLFPLVIFLLPLNSKKRTLYKAYALITLLGFATAYLFYAYGISLLERVPQLRSGNTTTNLIWLSYYNPYLRFFDFLLGCVAAKIYLCRDLYTRHANRILSACLCIIVVFLSYRVYCRDLAYADYLSFLASNLGLAPCVGLILIVIGRHEGAVKRLFTAAPLVFLGNISYSLYLFHTLSFRLVPTFSPSFAHEHGIIATSLCFIMAMLVAIILAYASMLHLEIPSRRWLRRKFMVRQ